MRSIVWRVPTALLLALLTAIPPANAESSMASEPVPAFDADGFEWAYGQVIDTITVAGNVKTASTAILREMELRAGDQLDAVKLERDHRYLTDLSSIATVEFDVSPVREGYCRLDITVTERPTIFLKLIYPIVEYNFDTNRFRYGLRVNNRNFRRRLETFSAGFTRNSIGDNNAHLGWQTRWLGWRHIGLGAWVQYFDRGADQVRLSVLERISFTGAVSLPLTDSRISFAQLIGSVTLARNRLGYVGAPAEDEQLVSPSLGFSLDRRNSPLRPSHGGLFFVDVQTNRVVNGNGSTYYLLRNDVRLFESPARWLVFGARSSLVYQFGKFPEYIRFGMGGAGTVRGYANGVFEGNHRWIQSLEARISPLPTWIFSVPYAKQIDVTLSTVLFVDTGIAWDADMDFQQTKWRGGFGFGFRLYSPFQDVVRVDFGFNRHGGKQFYFGTGIVF